MRPYLCYTEAVMPKTVHGVAALIENPKGELLVLLRQKDRPEPNVYGPPGGGLKFLKTYNHQWQSAGSNIKLDIFSYRINGSITQITINPAEATGYIWDTPQKLYARKDLLAGLYIILKDIYRL